MGVKSSNVEVLTIQVTPFCTNCYVIRFGEEVLVVDPGEVVSELLDAIKGYRVKMIVNTHGHCDHCGGNAELKRLTKAPLGIHKEDLLFLQNLKDQGQMFGLVFPSSPNPDMFLEDGFEIDLSGLKFEVRHTPGHTPGHISLVGDGKLFCGDVLFAGSIGRTDLPGGDYSQLLSSIQHRLGDLPDDTVVYSGHGNTTVLGVERRENPFLAQSNWLTF